MGVGTVLGTLATGFAGGVVSWMFTSFVGEPVQHLRTLRRAAVSKLAEFGNVGPPTPVFQEVDAKAQWDRVWHARAEIRKAAVDLQTFAATQPVVTAAARRFGIDVKAAGANLMGFANTVHEWGKDRHEFRKGFVRAMRLPPGHY